MSSTYYKDKHPDQCRLFLTNLLLVNVAELLASSTQSARKLFVCPKFWPGVDCAHVLHEMRAILAQQGWHLSVLCVVALQLSEFPTSVT